MSNASTAAIAQVIQGLAGAGAKLADTQYKDKLSQREAEAKKAELDAINKRVQEIEDAQKASASGIDLAGARQSMGPLGDSLYSSLAPARAGGSVPLGDKVRMATTPPPATQPAPAEAGPETAPPPADDSPLWERMLNEIQKRQQPKVKSVVERALDRTAAWMQAAQEQGVPAEEIQKMAASGELLRNLVKDVADSGDKLTAEKNKTGMEYLQQTSMDKRQKEMLDQQEKQAALDRAMKERHFKLSEAGKNKRAETLANSWKAQVAASGAITRANKADRDTMLKGIEQARKTRDPVQQAAILRAAGVPFDADSVKSGAFGLWGDKVLKSVTPRMDQVEMDMRMVQVQNEVMKEILKDGSYDPNSDAPDEFGTGTTPQQIVLPATVVDPGSTLPGANPKRTWLNP